MTSLCWLFGHIWCREFATVRETEETWRLERTGRFQCVKCDAYKRCGSTPALREEDTNG